MSSQNAIEGPFCMTMATVHDHGVVRSGADCELSAVWRFLRIILLRVALLCAEITNLLRQG